MICDRCGGENPDDVSFCRRCGHQIGPGAAPRPPPLTPANPPRPSISCPRCGSENPRHLRYCATCGTTLPKGETPTNPEGGRVEGWGEAVSAPPDSTAQMPPSSHPPLPGVPAGEEQTKHCRACGSRVVQSAMFCPSCGADQRQQAGPPSAVAPPPSSRVIHDAPKAKLIVIAQDGTPGREYPILGGRVDVGREHGEVLLSEDTYACPRHARITWKNGEFRVMDLGSVNGVYARLATPERLVHGDMILIGLEVFRFEVVNPNETAREPAFERGTRLFGSPTLPRYARLVQRTGEGVSTNVFYLSKNQSTIGRETGDFIFSDDAFMSRQHATFTRQQDGTFLLTDLGSSNGTFVALRGERVLPDGGHVRIGQHLFRLKVDG